MYLIFKFWGEIPDSKYYNSSIIYRSYHLFAISTVFAKCIGRKIFKAWN